jgi:hypothetical protein
VRRAVVNARPLPRGSADGPRRARGLALLVVCLAAVVAGGTAHAAEEYALKAEFIERFTHFVDWPDSAFSSPDAPFVICVLGENPFDDYLAQIAAARTIRSRKVRVSLPKGLGDVKRCHVLFVARSEKARLAAILSQTNDQPILTIGDTEGFAQRGVLINFYLDGDKVRFEVNADAVKKSGLKVSAQLMNLARPASANR